MSTSLPTPFGYGARVAGGDMAWIAIGVMQEALQGKRDFIRSLDMVIGYIETLEARYEPFRRAMREVSADTLKHDKEESA